MYGLLLTLCYLFASPNESHPYHFIYAEVEYIEEENIFEASMEITNHDYEHFLRERLNKSMSHNENLFLQETINTHFYLEDSTRHYHSNFVLEESELKKDGSLILYMKSPAPQNYSGNVFFNFDLFFETFPNQENKLTFINKNLIQTFSFNPIYKGHWITLN